MNDTRLRAAIAARLHSVRNSARRNRILRTVRRELGRILLLTSVAATGYALWYTAWQNLTSASQPLTSDTSTGTSLTLWHDSGGYSHWYATSLLALMAVTAVTYTLTSRARGPRATLLISGIAIVTLVLGTAQYLPCANDQATRFGLLSWVPELFLGIYEFDGPGKVCAMRFPPGFHLARALGLTVTFFGALALARVLLSGKLAIWRLQRSRDTDVVFGLSDATFPIVQALVAERRHRAASSAPRCTVPGFLTRGGDDVPGYPGCLRSGNRGYLMWYLFGLRPGDVRRLRPVRTLVLVIDPDPYNPLVRQCEEIGVTVLHDDLLTSPLLRSVLLHQTLSGPRLSLRRLFAVAEDQSHNLALRNATHDLLLATHPLPHHQALVPRVFVRLDDEREARLWRNSQMQHVRAQESARGAALVSDSITLDGALATRIVEELLPPNQLTPKFPGLKHLVLVGSSSLGMAILDELAWHQWCRYEVQGSQHTPRPDTVILCGQHAIARAREWERLRAPWCTDNPAQEAIFTQVQPRPGNEEDSIEEILHEDPYAVVVFVDGSEDYRIMASRIARADHRRHVMVISSSSVEAPHRIVPGGVVRLAPELVQRATGQPVVPTDSMSRLARQQHQAAYRKRWDTTESPPLGAATARHPRNSPVGCTKLTSTDWSELPDFFREDNIRQHWAVISWFVARGYTWNFVDHRRQQSPLSQQELHDLAKHEYARWRQQRLDFGWWACAGRSLRDDLHRLHPELDRSQYDEVWNIKLIEQLLKRLYATGLAPTRTAAPVPPSIAQSAQSQTHQREICVDTDR